MHVAIVCLFGCIWKEHGKGTFDGLEWSILSLNGLVNW